MLFYGLPNVQVSMDTGATARKDTSASNSVGPHYPRANIGRQQKTRQPASQARRGKDVSSNYLPILHRHAETRRSIGGKQTSVRVSLFPPFSPPAASLTGESRVNMKGFSLCMKKRKRARARTRIKTGIADGLVSGSMQISGLGGKGLIPYGGVATG